MKVKSLSHVRLLATPWTAAYQAPLSMGFSRQESWSGVHCLLPQLLQSCPILCSPVDCSPPSSSVHGILLARILEWIVMPSSWGFSQPRNRTCVSYMYVFYNYDSALKGSHMRLLVYDMKIDLIREGSPEEVRCKWLSEGCVTG